MKQDEDCCTVMSPAVEHRNANVMMPALILMELDPSVVVAGERLGDIYIADEVSTHGKMRETCPVCTGRHLQLVLRQKEVRIAHLFCVQCTRCFDACLADGSSALNS